MFGSGQRNRTTSETLGTRRVLRGVRHASHGDRTRDVWGYGDVEGSIGPFVAKVDPKTLKPVWYRQLVNTVKTGEWDYPGAMAIMNDGYIYVVSGFGLISAVRTRPAYQLTISLATVVALFVGLIALRVLEAAAPYCY
jgi:hypothetical protein